MGSSGSSKDKENAVRDKYGFERREEEEKEPKGFTGLDEEQQAEFQRSQAAKEVEETRLATGTTGRAANILSGGLEDEDEIKGSMSRKTLLGI